VFYFILNKKKKIIKTMNTNKFSTWFSKKLITGRYPLPQEIRESDFNVIINVSDEYIFVNHKVCMETNKKYFWFPMTEAGNNMGLNSIFGALQILWLCECNNEKVYLHCHAGSNRSVTVAQSYYYMRTCIDFIEEQNENKIPEEDFFNLFCITEENEKKSMRKMLKRNRIQNNIDSGHLPAKFNFETFLKQCEEAFKKYEIGEISLDAIKQKSNTLFY
jgi:hypothetical protein